LKKAVKDSNVSSSTFQESSL